MSRRHFEIIVVSDGATDNTRATVDAHAERMTHIRYHYQCHGGVAAARNTGIRLARGDLIAFLADDYVVPEDYCERMVGYFADPAVDAVKPRARSGGSTLVERAALHLYETGVWRQLRGSDLPTVFTVSRLDFPRSLATFRGMPDWSGAAMMRRSLFERFGEFDPALRAGEDTEMGMRLHDHGVRMHLCPDLFVIIHFRSSVLASLRRAYTYGTYAQRAKQGATDGGSVPVNPLLIMRHALSSFWLGMQISLHAGRTGSAIAFCPYILVHILTYRMGYVRSMVSRVSH